MCTCESSCKWWGCSSCNPIFSGLPWFPPRIVGTEPILCLGMCPWLLPHIWDSNQIIRKSRCKTCPFNHSSGWNPGDCMKPVKKMQEGLHCLSKYKLMDITGKIFENSNFNSNFLQFKLIFGHFLNARCVQETRCTEKQLLGVQMSSFQYLNGCKISLIDGDIHLF